MLVIGDWGREAQHGQPAVAEALARAVEEERSHSRRVVVLSTGDNFYKTGVSSVTDRQFNSSFEHVYRQPALADVPWLVALGNHDHQGSIQAQVNYSRVSSRWTMPAPYFARRLSPSLTALFLDTTPLVLSRGSSGAQQQLRWLAGTLAALPARARFVLVGHHNMYTMSIADHLGTPSLRAALRPLLRPYRRRMLAYVSGHEHSLMHLQDAHGGEHLVSGAGSKLHRIERPPRAQEAHWRRCCDVLPLRARRAAHGRTVWGRAVHGLLAVRFDGSRMSLRALGANGATLYAYSKRVP